MQFIGRVTEVKEVSGTTTRGEQYSGVELTVLENKTQEGQYVNCATVYVKNGTAQQFQPGTQVTVEARVDVRLSNDRTRKFNTVMCYYIAQTTY